MKLSKYQPQETKLVPEGKYRFSIVDDPIKKEGRKGGEYFIFRLEIIFENDSRRKFNHIIAPWEDRYADLLKMLGERQDEKGAIEPRDIELIGVEFEADMVHEADRDDPQTVWEKLINFKPVGAVADSDIDVEL